MKLFFSILFLALGSICGHSQSGTIRGTVNVGGKPTPYVTLSLVGTSYVAASDDNGDFLFENIPYGSYQIHATYIGYDDVLQLIDVTKELVVTELNMDDSTLELQEVVVTGTKTFKRKTDSPVIVNVTDHKTIQNVQACTLSESLRFQPGLRVETDCQTCNYTQLRLNGLGGGYSQILVNGRPIFSPLTGLYGMEQLPASMIDRIEVVRGGASSLYGSSAIGGTVNVITRIPKSNNIELDYLYQNSEGRSSDHLVNGSTTLVSANKNVGGSLFFSHRDRDFYDANNDNFSEIPYVKNTSFSASLFILPTDDQKVDINLTRLNEYRFGGEMDLKKAPHLVEQSEERDQNVWMGSIDYQINFNGDKSSLITYVASLLYKQGNYSQLRLNYGTGFRAPQAFDSDLHIAFAGGGVSRVTFAPDLKQERSRSVSASYNYDKPTDLWVAGFTLEGFYTRLYDAFYLEPIGEDSFGELFEKQNADGAVVQGVTLEVRGNFNRKLQLEAGMTLQSSRFESPIQYIPEVDGIREFTRTPNTYGYALCTYTPTKKWSAILNYVYTGSMKVPHFAGAPNQDIDEIVNTSAFSDFSLRASYSLLRFTKGNSLELYGGVKNMFNSFQNDFDIGKERDSNYIYGPSQPRTYYIGVAYRPQ